jgi:hypothetical protein
MFRTLAIAAALAAGASAVATDSAMAYVYCPPGYVYYYGACRVPERYGVVGATVGTAGAVAGDAVGTAGYVAGSAVNTAGAIAGGVIGAVTGR